MKSSPPRGAAALSSDIKDEARQLGFELVGISAVRPPPHEQSFAQWLRQGLAGELDYMKRTELMRRDPRDLVPWAVSVVSVGMNYYTEFSRSASSSKPEGWISRYAWGDDYHGLIKLRLESLLDRINKLDGGSVQGRAFVDSGPVLERDFAGIAGLCGRCDLCLKACPTGAFVGPYVLDARRCISYLTIELKGWMPRALRSLVGNHIFGCDICQEVCPYNVKARASSEPAYQPRAGLHAPELIPLLALNEEDFRQRFRGSPILRAKRRGFLRNVAVALGNLKSAEAVPALMGALDDEEPLVRGHAAWALGQIGSRAALEALQRRLQIESDGEAREEIAAAIEILRAAARHSQD